MIKIPDKPVVYVDVDDTLVLWNKNDVPDDELELYIVLDGALMWPHLKHIEMIGHFNARGHTVVVWSQGGSDWAEKVVKALGIEDMVDLVVPKPFWFIDDLTSDMFMNNSQRIWLDPKTEKKSRIKPRDFNPLEHNDKLD